MSATKVLDLAEKRGLLDAKAIADLRRQVAESKFIVTPEAIAKVLVDHGHLTAFQARRLVASALGEPPPDEPPKKPKSGPPVPDELMLADEEPGSGGRRSAAFAPAADDDVILLEAVSTPPPPQKPIPPAPRPASKSPPAAPPSSQPQRPAAPKFDAPKSESPKRDSPRPAPSPAAEELVELEPVAGAARSPSSPVAPPQPPPPSSPTSSPSKRSSWKKDGSIPPPPPPSEELVPLEPMPVTPGLRPLAAAPAAVLTPSTAAAAPAIRQAAVAGPLEDLTADPLTGSLDPLAPAAVGEPPSAARKARRNVWDSPLLLIGGGLLGVIVVAFGLLYYALTRGTAKELLAQADEQYKSSSYTSAIDGYQRFLKSYASDPNVSYVRVRLGMAQLRQASDDGRNPRSGLTAAKTVLPQIENEEKFNEARLELSTLLPDIADGFATQATEAGSTAQKEELVGLAGQAMELVNNPSYLPASLRKDREGRIAAILDKLKLAERSIQQDKDLVQALAKIATAQEQGNAAAAYQVRGELLKIYPALVANAELVAATRKVGDKERELVKVSTEGSPAATDDPQAGTSAIVLAPGANPPPAAEAKMGYLGLEGAVYGLDVASGGVLWRRHVGYETWLPPLPLSRDERADALIADSRSHELLRLAAATGKLVWRQNIGEPFTAPLIVGERVFVTTTGGRVLQIDAASGQISRSAQLPQPATVPAAYDARQSRLVQLGQHSTVFVLAEESLECSETYYLGHSHGSILVPPVAVLDYVLAAESPSDDHTLVHVLAPAGENKRLLEIGQPFRLKGRITTPLALAGRRVAAVTDLGQIALYEVDPANKQQPVRLIADVEASERQAMQHYCAMDANRLWVASRRCSMFEIQSSLQKLARKWSRHQDDVFVGPVQVFGDVVLHVRRRPGASATIVEGCRADDGQTLWTTNLAVPVAALVPAAGRQAIDAITMQGHIFSLSADQLAAGVLAAPAFPLPQGSAGAILPELAKPEDSQSPDHGPVVLTESQPGGALLAYDPAAATEPLVLSPAESTDAAACAGVLWKGNALSPRTSGKVDLLSLATGKAAALPFLPTLRPDELPQWTRPAVLPDGSGFVISDGRQTLYRVALKDQPKPHLAATKEQPLETPLVGSLVSVVDTIYGLARGQSADTVVAIDPQSLTQTAKWPLTGRAQFGPTLVQGLAFVVSDGDGLLCLDAGQKLRWQRPLVHGPLSGAPVAGSAGEILLLCQGGLLARINANSGDEIASYETGQPLGRAACLLAGRALASTSDGSILIVPLP